MITPDSIELKWVTSWGFSGHHHLVRRDENLKIQQETITNKNAMGVFVKPRTFYFIDDDPREFTDIDDLIEAYNEKFPENDETPEREVIYIRISRNRETKEPIKDEQNEPIK